MNENILDKTLEYLRNTEEEPIQIPRGLTKEEKREFLINNRGGRNEKSVLQVSKHEV